MVIEDTVEIARQVGHGDAAVALDALEDLRAAQGGRRRAHTRSSNSRRRTSTLSPRNSPIARTR